MNESTQLLQLLDTPPVQPSIVKVKDERGLTVALAVFPNTQELMRFDNHFPHYFDQEFIVSYVKCDDAFFLGTLH